MRRSVLQQQKRLSTPVFVFDDYVDYLKAWYGYAKRFRMTQKAFVELAGVGSQALFSDILARRKKLAIQHAGGFAKALELSGADGEYFNLLVQKEHARKGEEKEGVLKKLARLRAENITSLVSDTNAEYFSSWKYPVVREYIASVGHATLGDIKQAFLHFTMSLTEVRRTVEKLVQWKLVGADEETGGFRPVDGASKVTYSGMPHAVVNDVKRLFIESSVHAMETLPRDERHITMAIRGMSREKYREFCKKIDELRMEFLDDVSGSEETDFVYGLNVQLYPLMSANGDGNENNTSDSGCASSGKITADNPQGGEV